jgi:NAD(P)H-flavin reductase
MTRLNDEVMELCIKLPEGDRLQYLAGQYVEFVLKDGRHRAFSIANAPHADALLTFHIRRIRGGRFTDKLFSDMHEKDVLRIEGPKGSFYMREESDRPIVFLATGTGFGPIKAIVEHAIAEGHIVPMYLYWGARHKADLYLHEMAQQWAAEYANIHYIPVLSRRPAAPVTCRTPRWRTSPTSPAWRSMPAAIRRWCSPRRTPWSPRASTRSTATPTPSPGRRIDAALPEGRSGAPGANSPEPRATWR